MIKFLLMKEEKLFENPPSIVLFGLQINIHLSSVAVANMPTFMRRMRRASSWWTRPRRRRRPTRGTAWGSLRCDHLQEGWTLRARICQRRHNSSDLVFGFHRGTCGGTRTAGTWLSSTCRRCRRVPSRRRGEISEKTGPARSVWTRTPDGTNRSWTRKAVWV